MERRTAGEAMVRGLDRGQRLRLVGIVAVLALSTSVWAADVTGRWLLTLVTSGGETAPEIVVAIRQDGTRLTGNCTLEGREEDTFTIAGEIVDDAIRWQCATTSAQGTFTGVRLR